jgi:hypothetical protein
MTDSARFFYVSVIDGKRRALLAGPYDTHDEALALVEQVRRKAYDIDPKSHFYAFGTAGSDEELRTLFGKVAPEQAKPTHVERLEAGRAARSCQLGLPL